MLNLSSWRAISMPPTPLATQVEALIWSLRACSNNCGSRTAVVYHRNPKAASQTIWSLGWTLFTTNRSTSNVTQIHRNETRRTFLEFRQARTILRVPSDVHHIHSTILRVMRDP